MLESSRERLIGKGFDVKIHDANVIVSRLIGANRSYIDERLPSASFWWTTSMPLSHMVKC